SRALRYGSPCRAISGAVLGSGQLASLLSRCSSDRYCLITLSVRERGVPPFADFKRWSQLALAAFRSVSTKRSSFESEWLEKTPTVRPAPFITSITELALMPRSRRSAAADAAIASRDFCFCLAF